MLRTDNKGPQAYNYHHKIGEEWTSGIGLTMEINTTTTFSFLEVWSHMQSNLVSGLLLLFTLSHIILLVHPTAVFDTNYIFLFRILDELRVKFTTQISTILQDLPLSNEWISYGRLCSPRVLFVFLDCPRSLLVPSSPSKKEMTSPVKKLAHALEDQIYRIFKRGRFISHIWFVPPDLLSTNPHICVDECSSNSLFAFPPNQEFVYLLVSGSKAKHRSISEDPAGFLMNLIEESCVWSNTDNESRSRSFASLTARMDSLNLSNSEEDLSFHRFLFQHIDLALGRGFDDNVGRIQTQAHFEVPSAQGWFQAAVKLHNWMFSEENSELSSAIYSALDVDVKFSEQRCNKVLPIAILAYQEGLPPQYTEEYHEQKLQHAISVFRGQARGPRCPKFLEQLKAECQRIWQENHQMCEMLSLTGNPCVNPSPQHCMSNYVTTLSHRQPLCQPCNPYVNPAPPVLTLQPLCQPCKSPQCVTTLYVQLCHNTVFTGNPCVNPVHLTAEEDVDGIPHSSQVTFFSACDCGRKQGSRSDPFDIKAANYDFYKSLHESCCHELERIEFPTSAEAVVSPPRPVRPVPMPLHLASHRRRNESGRQSESGESLDQISHSEEEEEELEEEEATEEEVTEEDDELHLSSNNRPDSSIPDGTSQEDAEGRDTTSHTSLTETEYVPAMLTLGSSTDSLPAFPSWSLVCLGPSSIQDQPGFFSGSNFLLPWDVTVEQRDRWLWRSVKGKKTGVREGESNQEYGSTDSNQFTVKIFLGVEYECPRGHRFMCSAPDRVLRSTTSGLVKDNANRITSTDMPLYFPCLCSRSSKDVVAQLTRLHVVTPKAPVHVTLFPRVQPPSSTSVFCPALEPVRLSQSAYWVLRLPLHEFHEFTDLMEWGVGFKAVPNMEADAFAADSNMSTDAAPPYPWSGTLAEVHQPVSRSHLFALLEKLGLPSTFLWWIAVLYGEADASIQFEIVTMIFEEFRVAFRVAAG
ncbi:SMG8 [Cordylochernes scorpioides]|uniref:Nonsense-mediated mRNA decay factor SMG8 n=1 Tax=Cordylochernes scorpioides TaxID=51811 RepID=A0ABY6KIG4_9ARAC|nr:SMG8 [Cordylochernes scorpioides]